ncbi:uncharacterized protein G2W53_014179 [Senna tora]|uniref:Uncharacterized protein n=1 Tax=Senna tora TaxID=362788 RepID=A0A834WSZ7_9FABA|nr:uncharacterized protein G2W53_014179 [Senna tora]
MDEFSLGMLSSRTYSSPPQRKACQGTVTGDCQSRIASAYVDAPPVAPMAACQYSHRQPPEGDSAMHKCSAPTMTHLVFAKSMEEGMDSLARDILVPTHVVGMTCWRNRCLRCVHQAIPSLLPHLYPWKLAVQPMHIHSSYLLDSECAEGPSFSASRVLRSLVLDAHQAGLARSQPRCKGRKFVPRPRKQKVGTPAHVLAVPPRRLAYLAKEIGQDRRTTAIPPCFIKIP